MFENDWTAPMMVSIGANRCQGQTKWKTRILNIRNVPKNFLFSSFSFGKNKYKQSARVGSVARVGRVTPIKQIIFQAQLLANLINLFKDFKQGQGVGICQRQIGIKKKELVSAQSTKRTHMKTVFDMMNNNLYLGLFNQICGTTG